MKVSELKAFLADKSDEQEVTIASIPNYVVDVKKLEPVEEPKVEEVKPEEGAAPAEPVAA